MKNKKLIAIDLDGTTLMNNATLSKKTISALKRLSKNGHHIVIVTGRPWRMTEAFYKKLNLETPTVNFNGGLVHLPYKNWDGEHETSIDKQYILNLMNEKLNLELDFISIENKNCFLIDNFHSVDPSFFGDTHFKEENRLTKKNLKISPNSILVATKLDKKKDLSLHLHETFKNHLDVNPWGGLNGILEIIPAGINKAYGIKKIANHLQIPLEDTIAFGDELNDIELLKTVGLGVAMANSRNEIKEVADDVTKKTNNEDGVVDYLEKVAGLI